jgi:hypothetical protein
VRAIFTLIARNKGKHELGSRENICIVYLEKDWEATSFSFQLIGAFYELFLPYKMRRNNKTEGISYIYWFKNHIPPTVD